MILNSNENKFKHLSILSLFIAFLFAFFLLSNLLKSNKTNFENTTLNENTISIHDLYNSQSYYCKDVRDAKNCIDGVSNRAIDKKILWLGNSQIDAINQFNNGQRNVAILLHEILIKKNIDLITFSEPNASLQEHYVLFEYISSKIKLNCLILPLVFDDTRETGIRNFITPALIDLDTVRSLNQTNIGKLILEENSKIRSDNSDFSGLKMTLQENIEKSINNWLQKNFMLWSIREEARGNVFLLLYQLRNSIFSIKPESKRRIIKGRYLANISALKEILISAKQKNINVIAYIVPIRWDITLPYEMNEYNSFKSEVESIVKNNNGRFYNLERIVPNSLWGEKGSTNLTGKSEIDYMHFKYEGHKLLASRLFNIIRSLNENGL